MAQEKIETKTVKSSAVFSASPQKVYAALLDSKTHSKFTGAPAKISRKIGGKISVFGGRITGKNIKLSRGKLVVQDWRGKDWPRGNFSRAVFSLQRTTGGTKLILLQTGVPKSKYKAITRGWNTHYWIPMKKMFSESK